MINYGKQFIDSNDIKAVVKVLKSDLITQGHQVEKFESALKLKFGAKFCRVLSNGTAALHLAGMALGWKKGDIILTTPISFLATANCILYSGATPDFVDINNSSYNIDTDKLADKIKKLNFRSKKVVAVIATDYAGNPCDWDVLKSISKKYDVKLVNDNCHAMGASYNNDDKYAIKYADIVTHSYHPVKHITTGEGGAILTNDKIIDKKIFSLRSHGVRKDLKTKNSNGCSWYYEMHDLGFNYRITDFQCALGFNQLKKLNKFLKRRREIAEIYNSKFKNKNFITVPKINKNCKHAFHLYPLRINFDQLGISKKKLFKKLNKKKINLQVHYIPIHLQPFYKKKLGFKEGDFPVAEKFYKDEVSLPMYFSLQNKQVYNTIKYLTQMIGI